MIDEKKLIEDIKKYLTDTYEGDVEDIGLYQVMRIIEEQPVLNGGWIPFKTEYDRYFKMDIFQGKIPDEDEEILVTDGKTVWIDTFMRDGIECYLDSGDGLGGEVIAWMPLPKPYNNKKV